MTRGLFRFFVAVLTLLGSVAMVTGAPAPQAAAQPNGSSTTAPKFVKLSVDSVTPSTVTASSDPVLTVAGTVTNIGDRVVEDVSVRLQRAAAVSAPSELRSALQLDQVNYEIAGPFEDVVSQLNPGQRRQFTVTLPLRSDAAASLQITEPGVYPVLLNVNGVPAYGGQARLDDARFLLPVLSLPQTATEGHPPVPPPAGAPVATTMLWPLADRPRLVAGAPGSVDGQVELTDDELAASLGKGGRLDQLLGSLEAVLGSGPTRNRELASSICLAVDPDLLVTVQAMTNGYRVLASPSDPDGATREGTGAEQATAWLDRLRAIAPSLCTVALPFGQVDVTALAAVNDPELSARALDAPAEIVDSVLGVRSVRGVSLPDAGTIDTAAGMLLRRHGFATAVLADSATAPLGTVGASADLDEGYYADGETTAPDTAPAPALVRLPEVTAPQEPEHGAPASEPAPAGATSVVAGAPAEPPAAAPDPALRVATFDIWSATALAAVGSNPPTPSFTPSGVRYEVTNDSRSARLQDALGAVSWRALNPQAPGPRSLLVMPPQQWGVNADEATELLRQVESLMRAGLATPRAFTDLLAQPPDPEPYELDLLPRATTDGAPARFVEPIREQGRRITDLFRSMVDVPEIQPSPREFVTPLRDDLLRVLSLSDRRTGNSGQPDAWAQRRLDQTTRTVDNLYRSVTVLPPGGAYTLATEQSPLLLVARNDLPVAIRIRFRIEVPDGAEITDLGEQQLPPKGTRSFRVPTQVNDSRKLVIPISMTTADGVLLGESTSVSVRSNAYGQTLAIMTACAGLLLFLLAGRRLWHRFRGKPDPADEGFDAVARRRLGRYRRARKQLLSAEHAGNE
ncbi:DUF6049 family protein [Nocardia farcinica]|uniref:DUF6049 family protein n=1 Tax=Nocardia farcinica TaxID=37329 RepID=UPI000BF85687|nr:DUF6049 family protein [Nocardia farcinica]PFX01877.1 hypothetical protein CJ469_03192 [Nocardia farcinica]PFX08890.1 hypothetical protein CJ468_02137 [Nocardia farcinica]